MDAHSSTTPATANGFSVPPEHAAPSGRIEIANVSLRRGGREILRDINIRFHCGEVGVILGPNGAGKSTLLRIASGALRPDTGSVFFGERPLHSIPHGELARQRAMLSQTTSLSTEFTVAEVVALGRTPHTGKRRHRADILGDTRICAWALATVGLDDFAERRFSTLSGGEQQRVHLARVLAQLYDDSFPPPASEAPSENIAATPLPAHPVRWLLLDEPTSALDLRHQHTVLSIARNLAHATAPRLGVIAVLHDLNLALRYADTTVLMHDGAIAAAGPTRQTLTCDLINRVYGVRSRLCETGTGCPFIQTEPK